VEEQKCFIPVKLLFVACECPIYRICSIVNFFVFNYVLTVFLSCVSAISKDESNEMQYFDVFSGVLLFIYEDTRGEETSYQ